MKSKVLITLLLFLFGSVAGLGAGIAIQKVEYLTGEDFVQLHFQTDRMIPIPDLFYPESGNFRLILMRIPNIDLGQVQRNLEFDSPVIRAVKMTRKENAVEVEIRLRERLNYRVFTNARGLFIEFPKEESRHLPQRKAKKPLPKAKPAVSAMPVSGRKRLTRVNIVSQDQKSIQFQFEISGDVKYRVIPIPENPVRLAIDLHGVSSGGILRPVNHLNVKKLRGAYNTPDVFRLVFDLKELKDYSVTYDKGRLNVSFFDRSNLPEPRAIIARAITAAPEPAAKKPAAAEKPVSQKAKPTIQLKADLETKVSDEPLARASEFFGDPQAPAGQEKAERKKTVPEKTNLPPKLKERQIKYLRQTIESGRRQYTGEPMDFVFKDADIINVLKFIAGIAGLNLAIDPGVTGRVTSELTKVPWDQALELFLKINGLDMVLEGNILRVGRVDVLAKEASQRRKLKDAQQMQDDLEVFTRTLSFAKAGDVTKILTSQLSPRGKIMVDDRTNSLIISEVPNRIILLDKLLDTLDAATRQVSIEARIIESNVNAQEAFGVQWGYNFVMDSAYGNQTTMKFPNSVMVDGSSISNIQNPGITNENTLNGYAINLPAPGRTSGTVFSFGNVANTFRLDMAISALQRKGKVKIISSPRTTTQNNMEAIITQGRQIPVQTVQNNTVTVRFQPAALELKVTPQITAKGEVICALDIKNNSADFANTVNGIPPIITQSTKTTIRVADGETIAIGGLYRVENSVTRDGVPLLSKIPVLGSLFRNKQTTGDKRELLIFVTPRIIK